MSGLQASRGGHVTVLIIDHAIMIEIRPMPHERRLSDSENADPSVDIVDDDRTAG